MKNYTDAYRRLYKSLTIVADTVLCGVLFYVWMLVFGLMGWDMMLFSSYKRIIITLMLIYLVYAVNSRTIFYLSDTMGYQIVKQAFRHTLFFSVFAMIVLKLGNYMHVLTYFFTAYITSVFVVFTVYRLLGRSFLKRYRHNRMIQKRVVIVGGKMNAVMLYEAMKRNEYAGFEVLGYFDSVKSAEMPSECTYLGTTGDIIAFLNQHNGVTHLYMSLQREFQYDMDCVMHYCENHSIQFFVLPNFYSMVHMDMHLRQLDNVIYLAIRENPLNRVDNQLIKRLFDIVVSGVFLILFFPWIYVVVALITKLTMPGPVFFKQQRTGYNDEVFECLKFRSMRVNADADRLQATKDDPRKTKWGNLMRKTNIDELPQFINVLKGEMSIVGPRPHMLKHTEEYSTMIDKYMVRHWVKPGITGWSQVNGFRGETKELKDMEGRVKGDIWYIEHWSLWLDIFIMYKTFVNAVRGDKQAY